MTRLVVVVDDFALAALPGLDVALASRGVLVMRSFKSLPSPHLLARVAGCRASAVIGGADRAGLHARLETASATFRAPLVAALPPGVAAEPALRGPGVVDLIPAGARGAAERVVLMSSVPIVSAARDARAGRGLPPAATAPPARAQAAGTQARRAIGIASSTGGVWVLAELTRALAGDPECGDALLVAQHLEAEFVPFFADWLGGVAGAAVEIVHAPVPLSARIVYLAPGGCDLSLDGERVVSAPAASRYVPSGDRLLRSLAAALGPRAAGVVLSGMGSDGAEGLAEIARAGGRAVCQLPSTAVVPSMPESALRRATGAISARPEALAAALRG